MTMVLIIGFIIMIMIVMFMIIIIFIIIVTIFSYSSLKIHGQPWSQAVYNSGKASVQARCDTQDEDDDGDDVHEDDFSWW